jgi:broad specificity phosphatase PhoE
MPQPVKDMEKRPATKTFKLSVIRHGETYGNKMKILQGQMDYRLSEVGVDQARQLSKRLDELSLNAVFASDLSRAYETAQIMLEAAKLDLAVQRDPLIRERCFGIYEGRPSSDIRSAAQRAGVDVVDFSPEGGETLKQCQHRANLFCDYLCQTIGSGKDLSSQSVEEPSAPHLPPISTPVTEPSPMPPQSPSVVHTYSNGLEDIPSPTCSVVPDGYSSVQVLEGEIPHVAVVTHGGFMRCLFRHFHDKHKCKNLPSKGFKTTPPNTSVNTFLITTIWCPDKLDPLAGNDGGRLNGEWKVVQMECTALHDVRHVS